MSTASFTYHRKLIFAGLVFAFLVAGCAQTTKTPSEPKVADAATLRVGVTTTSPPFVFKQSGEIVGLDADMAREFARFIGKTPRFVDLKWDDQIPALLENRTDIIMSGMSITNLRQMSIAFSQPYYRSGLMAMVRKSEANRFPVSFYGLLGQSPAMRFGVVKGTTGEAYVNNNFTSAQRITAYPSTREALNALLTPVLVNRIDVFIQDGPILLMMLAENQSMDLTVLPSPLTDEYLAWGMRKTDPGLKESADRFLESIAKSGQLESIVKRWIPYSE
ncbi:MAG: ABC transporter substrate-binding protein [Desulfobacterales bacterium]|nr:ABC transporter substrate-binding protein [Desulfobacterales bacterium]